QNDVTLKMPAFEWVHVQLHQQKGMISLSPPTICNSAVEGCPRYGESITAQSSQTKGQESPVTVIDEDALKRAIQKAKEIADANPEKYRRVHLTLQ
ncbi:hypothetical protein ACWJSQ_26135, partial [Klebsiella pneumoniae]